MVANTYLYALPPLPPLHFYGELRTVNNGGKSLPLCHHALLPFPPLHSYDELCTVKKQWQIPSYMTPCSSQIPTIYHNALPPLPPLHSFGELSTVKKWWQIPTYMPPCSSSSSTSALLWWITHCKKCCKSLPICHNGLPPPPPMHSFGELSTVKKWWQIPTYMPPCSTSSSNYALLCWIMDCKIFVNKSLPIYHHALPPLSPLHSYGE